MKKLLLILLLSPILSFGQKKFIIDAGGSGGGGVDKRFGLEDSSSASNRFMNMDDNNLEIRKLGLLYTQVGGIGSYPYQSNLVLATNAAQLNFRNVTDQSSILTGEFYTQVGFTKTLSNDWNNLKVYSDYTYIEGFSSSPSSTLNQYFVRPRNLSGDYIIPLSVNGNYADSTGDIAISAGAADRFGLEDNTATETRAFDVGSYTFDINGVAGSVLHLDPTGYFNINSGTNQSIFVSPYLTQLLMGGNNLLIADSLGTSLFGYNNNYITNQSSIRTSLWVPDGSAFLYSDIVDSVTQIYAGNDGQVFASLDRKLNRISLNTNYGSTQLILDGINNTASISGNVILQNYGVGSVTGTPAYNLAVDASGNVIEVTAGGGGFDSSVYNSDGALTNNRVIDAGSYDLTINANQSGAAVTITNANSLGLYTTGTTTSGLIAQTSDDNDGAGRFVTVTSDSNSVVTSIRLEPVPTDGAGGDGLGTSIDYVNVVSGAGFQLVANKLISKWTDASSSAASSEFSIQGRDNGGSLSDIFRASGNGRIAFPYYGNSIFAGPGTPTRLLSVDNTGNVLEFPFTFGQHASPNMSGITTVTIALPWTLVDNAYTVVVTASDATAAAFKYYVTNKTSSQFDVVLDTTGSGVVNFDWILSKGF
jgi:hypothetical protein